MNSERLKQNFLSYVKDQFEMTVILDDFESVCLDEASELAINTTINNFPITQSYSFPALMKFVFEHWRSTAKGFLSISLEDAQTKWTFRNIDVPVDHSSREQTIQLFDQLNSLFEQ